MKKLLFILILIVSMAISGFTQERSIYTFIWNNVNENFRFIPLIGLVNIANGNFNTAEIGFYNRNTGNLVGTQAGFVNSVGADLSGVQAGFINRNSSSLDGVQAGFVNIVGGDLSGVQAGFINRNISSLNGVQAGFVNSVGADFSGVQAGFINTAVGNTGGLQVGFVNATNMALNGSQIGFVNTAVDGGKGFQLGFVNTSKQNFNGLQLGFINYADSIENGIPIGFISVVREGGYRAIEYNFSEFYPFTLGFKIGIERFYTTIFAGYTPFEENIEKSFAVGIGFGSLIPINRTETSQGYFFFNPELNYLSSPWTGSFTQSTSLVLNIGYNITRNFSITAGPSIAWASDQKAEVSKPLFSIYSWEINEKHSIILGARASIRLHI